MIKLLMLNLQKCMEGSKKMIYITGDERFHIIFPQLKKIEEHLKKEGEYEKKKIFKRTDFRS